ncbi:MAG: HAD-IA family hydrolase [candidate division NC10 bacterium]|nr:HAD-IA family hydrolase [candidate division NC10 bacterium]
MIPIDLFIFDMDGTLINSKRDLAVSTNFALRELGFPELSPEEIYAYIGDGIHVLMMRSLPEAERRRLEEAVNLFRSHYGEHLLDTTCLYPHVRETLEHFRAKKKTIATNKPLDFAVKILKSLGIEAYFDLVLGGESTENRKPHPEPAERILRELQVPQGLAAMVGDSPVDIEMGKRAGLITCAVTYGLRGREELERAGPDFLLDGFSELVQIFV